MNTKIKILISGASGFVGLNFIKYFYKSNTQIDVLDISKKFDKQIQNIFLWKDLSDITYKKYNAVIHLAGKAHDTRSKSSSESYFNINLGLTKKIFDKFIDSKSECFIFFSSVKAVADVVNGEILFEDVSPAPVGPYGESKLMAEKYILKFINSNDIRLTGKRVYILRPCMIHGPGNKGNLNLLYNFVKKGIPWPLGEFDNRRSFTSIENICFIISKLIHSEVPSGIFNIADDKPISTNRIIELISNVNNKNPRILKINKELIKGLAQIGDILHLPLNSIRLQKLTENYVVSNKKIKEALEIDELPVSAEEGLLITLKSFNK